VISRVITSRPSAESSRTQVAVGDDATGALARDRDAAMSAAASARAPGTAAPRLDGDRGRPPSRSVLLTLSPRGCCAATFLWMNPIPPAWPWRSLRASVTVVHRGGLTIGSQAQVARQLRAQVHCRGSTSLSAGAGDVVEGEGQRQVRIEHQAPCGRELASRLSLGNAQQFPSQLRRSAHRPTAALRGCDREPPDELPSTAGCQPRSSRSALAIPVGDAANSRSCARWVPDTSHVLNQACDPDCIELEEVQVAPHVSKPRYSRAMRLSREITGRSHVPRSSG